MKSLQGLRIFNDYMNILDGSTANQIIIFGIDEVRCGKLFVMAGVFVEVYTYAEQYKYHQYNG